MKKLDFFYNIAIVVLVIGIITVVIYKFAIPVKQPQDSFKIQEFEKVEIIDLSGNEIKLGQLMAKDGATYCIMFRINDCFSCVFDAIQDLKRLRDSGKACMGIIIHDLLDEVRGFTANYEFSPFFMIKRVDFYEFIKSPMTPVLVKFKNNKVESYRYFTPQ